MTEFQTITHIHQVIILDDGKLPAQFPPLIRINSDCARALYPDAVYKMWSASDLRGFLADTFEPDVLWAFDTLKPYSYKCDLARFCLLFAIGGLYVDLGVRMMNLWNIPKRHGIAAFRDVPFIARSWSAMQTGLIWSKPGRPELKQCIDWIIENCRTHFYGENPLYPTGPVLLGRAFIAAMVAKRHSEAADDQRIGDCRCITPEVDMLNVSYVSREATLIGLRTKVIGGDLAHLGLSGVNNYNQLWRSRQAYGEDERKWAFDDRLLVVEPSAARTKSGIAVRAGFEGRVSYGPFVNLEAGCYRLTVEFSPGTTFGRLFVDVSARFGQEILHAFEVEHPQPGMHDAVSFEFCIDRARSDVEFRPSVFGDFAGAVTAFKLVLTKSRVWTADDMVLTAPGVQRTSTGIAIPRGSRGQVLRGPVTALGAGSYTLTITFGPNTRFGRALASVCAGGGEVLGSCEYDEPVASHETLTLRFTLDRPRSGVEFRLEVFGDFAGEVRRYVSKPVDDRDGVAVDAAVAGLSHRSAGSEVLA